MELDIKTLSFVLLLTFFIQAIVFLLMMSNIKKYRGTNHWAISVFFVAMGFSCVFLRNLDGGNQLLILGSNVFIIGGLILFYLGSKYFFDYHQKNHLLIILFVLFTLIIGYYTFINNQIKERTIAFSAIALALFLLNAWLLIKNSKCSYRKAILLIAFIFIIDAIYFIAKLVFYLFYNENIIDFFTSDSTLSVAMLFFISTGLLWTYGLIYILNQRLNGELSESGNLLELILDNIPDGIAINDIKTFHFVKINSRFSALTGYSKEEVIGKKEFLKVLCKNLENSIQLFEELNKNGTCKNMEVNIFDKNGTEMIFLLSSTKVNIKGNDYFLTIGRDITEIKLNEQELAKKTNELEEMLTQRDKFFSILAHDLRGPVATAISLTELMTDSSSNYSKDEMQKFANALNKSVYSTSELLDNLLEWAGIHQGINAFSKKKTRFAKLMNHIMPSLLSMSDIKNITLTNDIPDDAPIFANEHMVQTIIRNLIVNAIKFTPSGGTIRLWIRKQDDGQTIYSVTDNGIGMNKNMLNMLFRIDIRKSRQGTNGELSSGLGLLLCREFVEKHGGRIWAESEVGKGSTFSFTLEPENHS